MIRLLGTPPTAGYNLSRLCEEAAAAWPDTQGVNEISDGAQLAIYLPDNTSVTAQDWQTLLDAHNKTQLSAAQRAVQRKMAAQDRLVARDSLRTDLAGIQLRAAHIQRKHTDPDIALLAEHVAVLADLVRTLIDLED